MKKVRLIDSIGKIDDEIIEKVSDIDTKEKLRREKMKEKKINKGIFGWLSMGIAVCAVIVGVLIINNNSNQNNELLQIPNPITEVEKVGDMKQYLGFVPKVLNKDVEVYQVIDDENKPLGEVIYKDRSRYRMSKLNGDISGIYGSEKEKEITINKINVTIYTMEDTRYATWEDKEYSYSYSTTLSNDSFEEELKELVK